MIVSSSRAPEVFEREPPLNVPYEFINIGGKKMSTSKGRGAAAHEIVEVIPPEQLRFFFLRPKPNSAVDFEPNQTDAVPRLFDEFDRFAAATAGKEVRGDLPPGYAGTFAYSLLDRDAKVALEAGGGLITVFSRLGEQLHDDCRDGVRDLLHLVGGSHRRFREVAVHPFHGIGGGKRQCTGN